MNQSIVEYFSGHEGYACGYCGSKTTCYSHGMWAHIMTPMDYQNLIDRGWRRSGKYCYKPTMNVTCCPLYSIRCEAMKFVLTRSQKKVLKKLHKFLATGEKGKLYKSPSSTSIDDHMDGAHFPQDVDMQSLKKIKKVKAINQTDIKKDKTDFSANESDVVKEPNEPCDILLSDLQTSSTSSHSLPAPKEPCSPPTSSNSKGRPNCRKAKEIRKERRLQKLLKMGMSAEAAAASFKKRENKPKSVEDFINTPLPPNPAHRLELRLVPSDFENPLFKQTFEESYNVFKKYQTIIHKDPPDKCSSKQYTRFLITNPFQDSSERKYGSFHHQYWLDGKLIGVGVLDLLPHCLSSVYFYYDPEYSFLSLGTYAALREIAYTRELNAKYQDLQYYYMGYYIHSCVKMRYKGQYVPSFLLCPETYTFHPIESCRQKLDASKYHRLEEDPNRVDTNGAVNMKEVVILYDRTKMVYPLYKMLKKDANDEQEVREYAGFVGRKCYKKLLLCR